MVEPARASVQTGAQCATAYTDPGRRPTFVQSQAAQDLGQGRVRQTISTEGCGLGERIVTYTDCATGTAIWLGGKDQPALPSTGAAPVLDGSVADDFMRTEEPRFAPDYDLTAMLARAKALPWVQQSGRLKTTTISVEGRRFDLNCGCKLFYPNGTDPNPAADARGAKKTGNSPEGPKQ